MTVHSFLQQLLIDEFGVAAETIQPESTLEDLGLDSFAMIEIIGELEREFGITFTDERARFRTLAEAAEQTEQAIRDQSA